MKYVMLLVVFIPTLLFAQPPRTMIMECKMIKPPMQQGRGRMGPMDMGRTNTPITPEQRNAVEAARRHFQQTVDSILRIK